MTGSLLGQTNLFNFLSSAESNCLLFIQFRVRQRVKKFSRSTLKCGGKNGADGVKAIADNINHLERWEAAKSFDSIVHIINLTSSPCWFMLRGHQSMKRLINRGFIPTKSAYHCILSFLASVERRYGLKKERFLENVAEFLTLTSHNYLYSRLVDSQQIVRTCGDCSEYECLSTRVCPKMMTLATLVLCLHYFMISISFSSSLMTRSCSAFLWIIL